MKFSHKLSGVVVTLLGVLFTLGGTLLVYRVFQNAIEDTVLHNTNQHILEKYTLETDMLTTKNAGYPLNKEYYTHYGERMTGYMGSSGQFTAFYDESGEEIYNNFTQKMPQQYINEALEGADEGYILRKTGEEVYMVVASTLGEGKEGATLLNLYNITTVYQQRKQNLLFFWKLDGVILLVAFFCTLGLSAFLTKPISRLNQASQRIAQGSYTQRVPLSGDDEIAQLAQSFNLMAEAVEEKVQAMELSMRQKDDFVSAFTHEIKTPMTTLIGYSQILRTKECEPQVRQRAATAIYFEAKRLEALSQSLLQLMGLGETKPELSPVSLEEVYTGCQRSLAGETAGGVEVIWQGAADYRVMAQPDLLLDLIRNLVLNAIAAKPAQGRVVVKVEGLDNSCKISVKDTGCGIPQEEIKRICEPFYMLDRSRRRKEGSTGLGLSIAQKIALLHGSELHFTSKQGEGTCVSFLLLLALPSGEDEV